MSTLDTVLLIVGLGLIGYALWSIAGTVRRLSQTVAAQAVRIAQLELDVKAATTLARKRLVAGRSGR
jgi:hypothetical protein